MSSTDLDMKFEFLDYMERVGLSFGDRDIDFLRHVWEDGWMSAQLFEGITKEQE